METIFGMFSFWDDLTEGNIDWETYTLIPDAQKNLYHGGSWRIAEKYGKTINNQAEISGIWIADISYLGDKPNSAKMFVYDEDGEHQFEAPSDWALPYMTGLNKLQSFTEVGSLEISNPTAFSDGARAFSKLVDEGADDGWFGMTGRLSSDVITGKVLDANWHGHVSTGISEPSSPYDGFKPIGVRESWDSYESQFDYEKVIERPYEYLADFSMDRSVLKEVDDYGFADIVGGLSEYGVANEFPSESLETVDTLLGIDEGRTNITPIQIRSPAKFKKKYVQRIGESITSDSIIRIFSKDFLEDQYPTFAVAGSKKEFKKLQESETDFIYFKRKGSLYFNENGSRKKMGKGGIVGTFKGRPAITSSNIVFG